MRKRQIFFSRVLHIAKWCACFCVFSIHAGQDNVRFETIGLEQGLSQQNVRAIHQDSEGFMWFGTQEGLNRFDGYQFKVFSNNLADQTSIGSSFVNSIDESADGSIWIATNAGVSVFNKTNQTFKHHNNFTDANGKKITEALVVFVDSLDKVWVGTTNSLNLYNPQKDVFEYIKLEGIKTDNPIGVESIAEDTANGIWIAAKNHGLFRFDILTKRVEPFGLAFDQSDYKIESRIAELLVDNDQRLWIGTIGEGVYVLDLKLAKQSNNSNKVTKIAGLDGATIRALYQDLNQTIWIGTESGLYEYDQNLEFIDVLRYDVNNRQSISDNKITSIYQDNGGVFWVGTYRGLNKWNTATAKFDYYRYQANRAKSLSNPNINTIYGAGKDKVWIGTHHGLNLTNLESGDTEQFKANPDDENSLASNNVTALYAPNESTLWLGYRDKGLTYIDNVTGQHTHYKKIPNDPTSLGSNGVTSIIGAESGAIWVGAFNGGLNRLDLQTGKFQRHTYNAQNKFSLSSNKVISIYEDSSNLLWVGTLDGGVNLFNPALGTSRRIMNIKDDMFSLGSNEVWAIHEDKEGNIWLGTAGAGLNYLSVENRQSGNYRFERIGREQGLPSSVVFSILEDPSGMLWLSTNRGITKFDPLTRQILNYDTTHGLQGNEFNAGAYHKMSDGRFLFGGTNGVTGFYADDIEPNQHVPPVVLTNFQRLNEVSAINSLKKQQNKIVVSHKDYLLAFEFAGLDFASPDNNRYAYKLEGFDAHWIEARDVRKATYTNLPAGDYIFRVKASNNDGIWNENGADIALRVLPAPWFSWWAYTIYTMIFLAAVFWLYRYYLNKLKREEIYLLELENQVQKRTVELSAANEQLLNASTTDQLTGLHNRRYLANVIKQMCSSTMDEFKEYITQPDTEVCDGPRLFFLMLDLDGFKPVNDSYGHDAGDKVIVQLGELLRSVCREEDIVVRWGGDEFIMVGKIYEKAEASTLAERIRDTIARYGFEIGLPHTINLSSSIGYAMYPFAHSSPDSLSWEQVNILADKALYRSKDSGKNTWCALVEPVTALPVGAVDVLTKDLDNAIEQQYVIVETPQSIQSTQAE